MEYASKGIANAGLTTGIIGTALSGLLALGGNNILGGRMAAIGAADGEHLVSFSSRRRTPFSRRRRMLTKSSLRFTTLSTTRQIPFGKASTLLRKNSLFTTE